MFGSYNFVLVLSLYLRMFQSLKMKPEGSIAQLLAISIADAILKRI